MQEEEKKILTHRPIICPNSEAIVNSKHTENETAYARQNKPNVENLVL